SSAGHTKGVPPSETTANDDAGGEALGPGPPPSSRSGGLRAIAPAPHAAPSTTTAPATSAALHRRPRTRRTPSLAASDVPTETARAVRGEARRSRWFLTPRARSLALVSPPCRVILGGLDLPRGADRQRGARRRILPRRVRAARVAAARRDAGAL